MSINRKGYPVSNYLLKIDTSSIYIGISGRSLVDNGKLNSFNKEYLKFYSNGKVGVFYSFNSENPNSLNPKKADMGFYGQKDSTFLIKTYFEHPQGGGWVEMKVLTKGSDSILLRSNQIEMVYVRKKLDKSFLVFNPDW